ncbi:MAG: RNA polymerase sigma factor [Pseudomonadota bacterium]
MEDGDSMLAPAQDTTTQTALRPESKCLRDEDLSAIVAALRRYALALLRDPVEADDLVQESLVRAMTYNPHGIGVRRWRPYLFSILHNLHLDQRSKLARMRETLPIVDSAPQIPSAANQQDRLAFREVVALLARLPDEQREVILLAGLEGLSYKEVAEIVKAPVGTVMSRLSRGRRALRILMEQGVDLPDGKAHRDSRPGRPDEAASYPA